MALLNRIDLVQRLNAKQSVSNFIMTASYDEAVGVYTLADLSVAVLFDVEPVASSVFSDQELENISDGIASALSRIKPPAYIQSIIVPSTNVERDVKDFLGKGGDPHPLLAMHADKIAENFRRSVKEPLYTLGHGEAGFRSKRFRVLHAIIIRPNSMVGGAFASFVDFLMSAWSKVTKRKPAPREEGEQGSDEEEVAFDDAGGSPAERRYMNLKDSLIERVLQAAHRFESTFKSNNMPVRRILPSELLSLYGNILAPKTGVTRKYRWNQGQPIAEQVAQSDVAIEPSTGSIYTDKVVYKVLSLCGIPESTAPGVATLPQQALSWSTLLDFLGDGFITLNASSKPRLDLQQESERRITRARNGFVIATKAPIVERDAQLAIKMSEQENRLFYYVQLTICIWGDKEREVQERAEKLRDKAADIGLECRIEQHYAPSLFFQSLPFGFLPTLEEPRRLWLMPDRGVSDLMPLYMYSRGTQTAAALFHNRLGEPFRFSVWDSPNAAHVVVAGDTGSGKSFLASYLQYCGLRVPDSQSFLIDKGKSYSVITTMLGAKKGDYNQLGLSGGTCINPFAGTMATSASFARELLAHLASQENDKLNSQQKGVLDACIVLAYKAKQKNDTWRTWEGIFKTYPKGAWVHKARKRLHIDPLDEGQWQRVVALKSRDVGREPKFEIYFRCLLTGRQHRDLKTGQPTKLEQINRKASVDQKTVDWLTRRGFIIETCILENGDEGTILLYEKEAAERTLEGEGFTFTPLRQYLVLEVERREDLEQLEECEIQAQYPNEFLASRRERIIANLHAKSPNAPADVVEEVVAQGMTELRATDYYDTITGHVVIQNEVFFRDIDHQLEMYSDQDCAKTIRPRLQNYHGEGNLASFFDGETKFTLEGRKIVTFELGELASAGPHLLSAVVGSLLQMLLLYCQSEHLPNNGPRSFDKYILLDEFWQLLEVPMVFDLVKNGLKTLRKHRTSMWLISQRIRDFADSANGKVILGSVQHRIILKQQQQDIRTFGEALGWSQEKINLMYTVHSSSPRGLYSEAMIDCNHGVTEVVKFVATPYSYWLFTTEPSDLRHRDRVKAELRKDESNPLTSEEALAAALDICARQFPNGVQAARARPRAVADDVA